MEHTPKDSEVGCSINLVTGEHYGPCKGSCGPDEAWEALARFMGCTDEQAKLMLAAPELLKALEHVRTTLDNIIGDNELIGAFLPPLLLDVRAAIEEAAKS